MNIYAYNNPYNTLGQIITRIVPFGIFAGEPFDDVYNAVEDSPKSHGTILAKGSNGEEMSLLTASMHIRRSRMM